MALSGVWSTHPLVGWFVPEVRRIVRRRRPIAQIVMMITSFQTCPGLEPGSFQTQSLEQSRTSGAPLRKSFALYRIRDTSRIDGLSA